MSGPSSDRLLLLSEIRQKVEANLAKSREHFDAQARLVRSEAERQGRELNEHEIRGLREAEKALSDVVQQMQAKLEGVEGEIAAGRT